MLRLVFVIILGLLSAYPTVAVTVIRSETSSTANTGGNTGSGSVKTGDARAETRSDTMVGGEDDQTTVTATATAKANDEEVSVSVENSGEPVSEQAESGGAQAEVVIDTASPQVREKQSETEVEMEKEGFSLGLFISEMFSDMKVALASLFD